MLVGVVKLAPSLPIDTLFPFFTLNGSSCLGFHFYDLGFQSPIPKAKPIVLPPPCSSSRWWCC